MINVSEHTQTVGSDRPGLLIEAFAITCHNQGNSVVKINGHLLLPDDQLVFEGARGFWRRETLNIKFLQAFNFRGPVVDYPQLYNSDRVLITKTFINDVAKFQA